MRALSVRNPWIALISMRVKTLEVRSRTTTHRGPLLLCVGVRKNLEMMARWNLGDFEVANGVAICVVDLVDSRPALPDDEARACCKIAKGEYVWEFANARPVERFPVAGQLSMFTVPDERIRILPWRAPTKMPTRVTP